jgi:hypothetical protein
MELTSSDFLFLLICLWLVIAFINNDGGGGRRARVPDGA